MNVGDYVRYKYENFIYIGKIKFIREVMGFEETLQLDIDTCMEEILKEEIIKSSPNIIDLIEVGDYVDRLRVVEKQEGYIVLETFDERIFIYKNEPIKSIVTKEQFKEMEYKVND